MKKNPAPLITVFAIAALILKMVFAGEAIEIKNAYELLKIRKDTQALVLFEKILEGEPDNPGALWGKAEILRRSRKYKESEAILNKILKKDPDNPSALLSLSYIKYNDNKLKEALAMVKRVSKLKNLDRENKALAFMMLGTINSKRSSQGWLLNKINYGLQIKSYFLKANKEAPELAEVHLGLGTFYLKAPSAIGGNLDKAIEELQTALKLAPEFATANARLAQAYKKKGNPEKYNFYLQQAKKLDPGNEALQELEEK